MMVKTLFIKLMIVFDVAMKRYHNSEWRNFSFFSDDGICIKFEFLSAATVSGDFEKLARERRETSEQCSRECADWVEAAILSRGRVCLLVKN